MAQTFFTVVTKAGQAAIANAIALGQQVQITQMEVGDGNGAETPPTPSETQTALVRRRYINSINSLSIDPANPNWLVADLVIPPSEGGWNVTEFGIRDVNGNLFAVGSFPKTYKPAQADNATAEIVVRCIIQVSNAATVQLVIDPTIILATRQWVINQLGLGNIIPGGLTGQVLTKNSNTSGDASWKSLGDINVVVKVIDETQAGSVGQDTFLLTKTTTDNLAVYVDGVRIVGWTKINSTTLKLPAVLGKASEVYFVQNDPNGVNANSRYTIAVIGDSLTAQNIMGEESAATLLQNRLDHVGANVRVVSCAIDNGSFYRANNTAAFGGKTAVQQAIAQKPDAVVIALGMQDILGAVDSRSLANVQSDAQALFTALRNALPNTKIIYASELAFDTSTYTSANAKNQGVAPAFWTLRSTGALTGLYCSEILTDAVDSATQTKLANWQSLDTYIKGTLAPDSSFTVDYFRVARLGGTGPDMFNLTAPGKHLVAGYVIKGLVSALSSVFSTYRGANLVQPWSDPDNLFFQALTKSGEAYVPVLNQVFEQINAEWYGNGLNWREWYLRTKPIQPLNVAMGAYLSANATISTANSLQLVALNTKEFDGANSFDVTNKYFKPTRPGKYRISAVVTVAGLDSGSTFYAALRKSGAAAGVRRGATVTGAGTSVPAAAMVDAIIQMNGTTDYVELMVSKSGSTAVTVNGDADGVNTFMHANMISGSIDTAIGVVPPTVDGYTLTPSSTSVAENYTTDFALLNHYNDGTSGGSPAVAPTNYEVLSGPGSLTQLTANSYRYNAPRVNANQAVTIRVRNTTLGYSTTASITVLAAAESGAVQMSSNSDPATCSAIVSDSVASKTIAIQIIYTDKNGSGVSGTYSRTGATDANGDGIISSASVPKPTGLSGSLYPLTGYPSIVIYDGSNPNGRVLGTGTPFTVTS